MLTLMPALPPRQDRARGGIRQRLAASTASAAPPLAARPSALSEVLLRRWSWGHSSLVTVQEEAHAAVKDFESGDAEAPGALRALAALGSWGRIPRNLQLGIRASHTWIIVQKHASAYIQLRFRDALRILQTGHFKLDAIRMSTGPALVVMLPHVPLRQEKKSSCLHLR